MRKPPPAAGRRRKVTIEKRGDFVAIIVTLAGRKMLGQLFTHDGKEYKKPWKPNGRSLTQEEYRKALSEIREAAAKQFAAPQGRFEHLPTSAQLTALALQRGDPKD
jgi:hypothetical protein